MGIQWTKPVSSGGTDWSKLTPQITNIYTSPTLQGNEVPYTIYSVTGKGIITSIKLYCSHISIGFRLKIDGIEKSLYTKNGIAAMHPALSGYQNPSTANPGGIISIDCPIAYNTSFQILAYNVDSANNTAFIVGEIINHI
jgi:hypothetical protein